MQHSKLEEQSMYVEFGSMVTKLDQGGINGRYSQLTKKTRRRKASVPLDQHLFKCGCGKTYLSYAALYTHAKTKHEGVFPEGSNTGIKKKQGRPKKVHSEVSIKLEALQKKTKSFNSKIEEIVLFAWGQDHLLQPEAPARNISQGFLLEETEKTSPSASRLKHAIKRLEEGFKSFEGSQHDRILQLLVAVGKLLDCTCTEAFSYFLLFMSQWLDQSALSEVFHLLVIYMECLETYGQQKLDEVMDAFDNESANDDEFWQGEDSEEVDDSKIAAFVDSNQSAEGSFCQTKTAEVVADLATLVFKKSIPDAFVGPNSTLGKLSGLKMLGTSSEHKLKIICVIKLLCNWLNKFGFTRSTLEYNRVNSSARDESP